MSTIVAARFWVCEFCGIGLYELDDIKNHLEETHGIKCKAPQANAGLAGDNLIVSDCVIPANVRWEYAKIV